MLRAADEHDLFQHVCDITLRLGDFAGVWIGTVDFERGEILPQFAAGELAPRILRATFPLERERPSQRPLVADVFLSGETRVIRDLDVNSLDARWVEKARAVGVRAVASVPLRRGGAVIGALTLNSRTHGDFDPEVVTLLEAVGRTTSAALDNLARIDALREREAQLRMAQKMEAIGRLAGGVAHDFNNILCVIGSYADLAMDRARVDPSLVADLEEIQAAGKRAEGLTRQLLAFSRKQVLQPEVLSLNALVGSVEKMLRRLIGEDIALRFTPGDELWLARVDPGQIEQVLMNLAVNARDAMPSGGSLTLETANVSLTDEDVAQRLELRAGDFVALTVTDDGVGMDEAIRARIFEPFFTTKGPGQGTGLGLAMVYGIVKQSGGTIAVTSAPGEGARFQIYFPREQALPVTSRPATTASRRPRGTETVLVVEDEERVRGLVRRILHTSGYRVLTAANADEAVRCCEGAGTTVDLLLTDIVMPGMNGRDLAARITAARPHVRVLFMSGYTDDAIAARGALAPGTRFIGKPFNAEELTRRVRATLDDA